MRERKNHYSIRKLTIGVASVLIGISFFGIKADTVQAETGNSNESISQESEQTKTNANTSNSAQDETITPATTERQNAGKSHVVEAETELTADSPSNSTTSNVQEDRTDPAANRDKIGKEAPSASATFGKNSTLTIDHGQLDEKQKTAKLTMNSANFQAGDTYTITIPKKGGLSLGTTDVAVLAPVFGKTTFTETIDYYKIEDHFINGGTITQNINLHYDKKINPLASMTNTITVDTTGSAEKHASLKVIAIGKEPELSADLVHVPQPIINGQEFTTRPALTLGTPLKDFNQVDLNLALDKNYKLTNITLNDEDQSLVLTPDQLTIDANNVAHIVLNEEQITSLLKGQSNHFNFKITGHFDIPASDFVNKKYHAKFLDKDKSTISGTMVNVTTKPSHIGTITGTGVDDLTIYPTVKDIDWAATVNYLTEYTAHDKENPGKDTSGVMVVDGKASSTTDMHYFTLSNQSTLDITDANLTVDLPDGYNVPATLTLSENTIYQDQDQDPDNINFIVSYVDGTSAVITPDQFGNTLTFHVTPNKKIRSLNVRIAQWNPDVEYDLSSKHGTYSKTYANGQPVLVGDLLTTKTTLSSPSFNGEVMMPMTTVIDRLVNKVKEGTFTAVYPAHQTSTVPGEKNAGTMTYETCVSAAYGHPMLKHPITYIMVPDNAEVADLSKVTVKYSGAYVDYQPLLTPKSVSVITVDGHRFVKIDCSNYDLLEDGLNVTVPYSNAPDVQNSTKPTVFFTVADNLKNGNLNDPDHTVAQALKGLVQKEKIDTSKVVYNGSKAWYPGSWIINTVEGMSSATMVSGNTSGISTLATQDVHGINPDQMKIYGSIINATNNQVANAYQIINIPDSQDKVSQFTPTMSGQASLIDAVNGTDLSSAGELLYSTALTDLNNAQAAAADGHWLTADQITNWSKVKSVMLKFDSKALPARTSARVEIPLVDKDIYQHVGKSISVSSAIFSENKASSNSNLPNLTILPGKPASAKLTVIGQAKVNVKVHYKDDQGNDHYVDLPDQAKTYHEGQDIMKPEDFMTKNSDLTDADRILLPAGIVINWAAGPTIQNSDAKYAAGYQHGTAAFDQTVAPDFDGDTLIYEGAFAKPVTDTHKVTRTIKFVDQNGKQIYHDVAQHSKFTRSGFEDPFTHKIAWAAIPGSDILLPYPVPKIPGYTPDKSQVEQATVKFGDPDSAITVTYKANSQVIKVNFIDDTTGETLNSKSLDGVSDEDANYNTKADINNYEKQHYVLVSDSSDGQDLIFDHDDQAMQSYDIHFTHDTNPDSRQDTVTRTITYTGAGNKTPSAVTQSVHFTQAGTKDLVTGKTKWNDVADQNFASVGTPEVAGYTPDKSQVEQAAVKFGDKDTTVTVTYAADKQQAKLHFYDDTAKKFIDAAPVLDASGKTDGQVGFTIPNSYDFSKYNFVNVTKGADPESTDQLAGADLSAVQYGKYDTDDKKDQVFVAHFTHKIKAINEKVTVNETIHYVYEDGSKAHDDYQATPLVFTKTGTKDLVTGEEKATWTKSQKFAEVASPEIPGYTPDQAVVPAVEVAHGDNDVVRTVTYSKNIEPQEPTTPTDNPVTPKAPEEPQQPATPDDNPDVVRPHSDNSPQKKQDSKQTNKTTEVNKTVKRSSTVKPKATAITKRNGTKVQLATKDASKQSNPKAVVNSTSTTVVNNKGENKAETLPQTGEKDNKLGILGLLTLSLASLFGFSEKKKKED